MCHKPGLFPTTAEKDRFILVPLPGYLAEFFGGQLLEIRPAHAYTAYSQPKQFQDGYPFFLDCAFSVSQEAACA